MLFLILATLHVLASLDEVVFLDIKVREVSLHEVRPHHLVQGLDVLADSLLILKHLLGVSLETIDLSLDVGGLSPA